MLFLRKDKSALIKPYTHVAKELNVNRGVLKRLIDRGEIFFVRSGRIVLVDVDEARKAISRVGVGQGYRSRKRTVTVVLPPLIEKHLKDAWPEATLVQGSRPEGASTLKEVTSTLTRNKQPLCFLLRRADVTNQKAESFCERIIASPSFFSVLSLQSMQGSSASHSLLLFDRTRDHNDIRFLPETVPWNQRSAQYSNLSQALRNVCTNQSAVHSVDKALLLENPFPYPRIDPMYLQLRKRLAERSGRVVTRMQDVCADSAPDAISGGLSPKTVATKHELPDDSSPYLLTPSSLASANAANELPVKQLKKIKLSGKTRSRHSLMPGDIVVDPLKPDSHLLWCEVQQKRTAPCGAVLGPGLYRLRLGHKAERIYSQVFSPPIVPEDDNTPKAVCSFAEYWQALAVGTRGRRISMRDLSDMPVMDSD